MNKNFKEGDFVVTADDSKDLNNQNFTELAQTYYPIRLLPDGEIKRGKPYSFTTQLILNTAAQLGMKITPIPDSKIIQLEFKGKIRYFFNQIPAQFSSLLSQKIVNNKSAAKHFLDEAGFHRGFTITKKDSPQIIEQVFSDLQKPLVIKPLDGAHGDGIFIKIKTLTEFENKLAQSFKTHSKILIEEMCAGTEYRLTATREKLLAVTERIPANVVGDNQNSIGELITEKNIGRAEDTYLGALVQIIVDDEMEQLLEEQDYILSDVPLMDEKIQLKRISNISAGGDSVDLTDQAHPSIAQMATAALKAIPGLQFGGIDLICQDITQPLSDQKWVILEINDSPGFCMAEMPAIE